MEEMDDGIIDLVLGLNTQALALLRNDEFDPAMEDLRTALNQMRHLSSSNNSRSGAQQQQSSLSVRLQSSPPPEEGFYRRVVDSGDVILGQGFTARWVANTTTPRQLSVQDTSLLTATLLFNLALTYHLRGVSVTDGSGFTDQRMALHLYQHAMGLSLEQFVPLDPTNTISLLLVAMGNNLCSVAASLGKLEDLRLALEWTQACCRTVAEHVPFFWLNVTFWNYMGKNPAAAA